eukprot:PITA_15565
MDMTSMEKERSMLNDTRLGQELWVGAVDTACYLFNKSPSSVLEDKTPHEVWTDKKSSLSHMRVFYCDANVHVQKVKRTKLDSKFEREVVDLEDRKLWKEAMVDEMTYLDKNEACDLAELPSGRKLIGNKWVFKKKMNVECKVDRYKYKLVEKGYSQVLGIDFGDIFSLVSMLDFIILVLSVSTTFYFEVEQMDMKTKFLHKDTEEEIYMKQREGFVVKGKK